MYILYMFVSPSCPVAFPCGRQQEAALHWRRSLWGHSDGANITLETEVMFDGTITESWFNSTEVLEELGTVNASQPRGSNQTQLQGEEGGGRGETGEALMPRIVGGVLERRGQSPWQVNHIRFG